MPRPATVRGRASDVAVERHPLSAEDPGLAAELGKALNFDIVGIASHYSAMRHYRTFCDVRRLRAFPTDEVLCIGWIARLLTTVKPTSLKSFLAALHREQTTLGYDWDLKGNERVARVLRYYKRKYPEKRKAKKVGVTLAILKNILPLLPNWPCVQTMAFEDVVFACASMVACTGFLRGGEFLFRPGQARPLLLHRDLVLINSPRGETLVMSVPQIKTEWWIEKTIVPIFALANDDGQESEFSPVRLWKAVTEMSPCLRRGGAALKSLPAFHNNDGTPLRRDIMVNRTRQLMEAAEYILQDENGDVLSVWSSSWRAGAVRSAVDAETPEAMIQICGRWKTDAWKSYFRQHSGDLQRAVEKMWATAALACPSGKVVKVTNPVECNGRDHSPPILSRATQMAALATRLAEQLRSQTARTLPPKRVRCIRERRVGAGRNRHRER
jgi:hypothetical protein